MLVKKVIFKDLNSTFPTISIGGIRFKQTNGKILEILPRNIIINSSQRFENDVVASYWISPPNIILTALYPINAVTTDRPQTSYNWLVFPTYTQSLTKPNSFVVEFKKPVDLSEVQFVLLPDHIVKTGVNLPFTLEVHYTDGTVSKYKVEPVDKIGIVSKVQLQPVKAEPEPQKPKEETDVVKKQEDAKPPVQSQPQLEPKPKSKPEPKFLVYLVDKNQAYLSKDRVVAAKSESELKELLLQSQLSLQEVNELLRTLKGQVKVLSNHKFKIETCTIKEAKVKFSKPIHLHNYCPKLVNFELEIRSNYKHGQVSLLATIYTGHKTFNLEYDPATKVFRQVQDKAEPKFFELAEELKLTSMSLPLELANLLATDFDIEVTLLFKNLRCDQEILLSNVKLSCAKQYIYLLLKPTKIEFRVKDNKTLETIITTDTMLQRQDIVLLKLTEK